MVEARNIQKVSRSTRSGSGVDEGHGYLSNLVMLICFVLIFYLNLRPWYKPDVHSACDWQRLRDFSLPSK